MNSSLTTTQAIIDELVRATNTQSPIDAIRVRARELIAIYESSFGRPEMPIDIDILASLKGIQRSDERPVHSPDAELVPDGSGGVTMRVNPDQPGTRRRFSIAHEISHTFFPEYQNKEWCRTDARFRDRNDPDQFLEMLCDIGAAELLFPTPWFSNDANRVLNAAGLLELANKYQGSREATLRRYAELSDERIATVYFAWKLKPVQKGVVDNEDQGNLFGMSREDQVRDAIALRIEYSIPSPGFQTLGHFLPPDKSIENLGPIYDASASAFCIDGECHLELGTASGTYSIMAIPLPTPDNQRGPNGENSVAAILRPNSVKSPHKKRMSIPPNSPTLFD